MGFSVDDIKERDEIINAVSKAYGFDAFFDLKLPTTKLDSIPYRELVSKIGEVFKEVEPNIIYIPFNNDVHTDHKVVFNAICSCIKWFRYPSIQKVLMMEILSETEFGGISPSNSFMPNVFVDITAYLEKKIEIMGIYKKEISTHPFPRSEENIGALASLRGAMCGVKSAESFMLLKEIIK